MPTWLVHGFRWPRIRILYRTLLENLDDCSPSYIMTPAVSALYLENFTKTYPEIMAKLPSLRLLEQYDPEDLVTKEQPYAYVCDQVHEVKLSVDIEEIRGRGVTDEAWTALMDLRDQIAVGQDIGWFVVINGDPERWAPPLETDEEEDSEEEEDDDEGEEEGEDADRERSRPSAINRSSITSKIDESTGQQNPRKPRGFRKWFTRSKRSLNSRGGDTSAAPPIPTTASSQ